MKNKGIAVFGTVGMIFGAIILVAIISTLLKKPDNTQKANESFKFGDSFKYQEVVSLGNDNYIQCIDGTKYIVQLSGTFTNGNIKQFLNNENQAESCQMKLYSLSEREAESNINKTFVRVK